MVQRRSQVHAAAAVVPQAAAAPVPVRAQARFPKGKLCFRSVRHHGSQQTPLQPAVQSAEAVTGVLRQRQSAAEAAKVQPGTAGFQPTKAATVPERQQ